MTVGSLFAGIGGFDLGLERAGFTVKWQCEIDPFCQAVLAQHWPAVVRYGDIRRLGVDESPDPVDLLCGGFPCQDISNAGKRAGIEGTRSGLWSEFARLIGALRPRYVLVENVAALLSSGLGRVLGDLAACGYDAEWDCLPASAFGAPHRRDRVWLVAYPESDRMEGRIFQQQRLDFIRQDGEIQLMAYAGEGLETWDRPTRTWQAQLVIAGEGVAISDTHGTSVGRAAKSWGECHQWRIEPDVGRVAHGIPARVDRLRGLGNAIVPQIAEWIGRQILHAERVRPV